jgi:protocatechuate 3,4-dioxygenase beta subunit
MKITLITTNIYAINVKVVSYISLLIFLATACQSQTKSTPKAIIGGPCEGCEAIYEYGDKILMSVDTLPGFHENEPKLKIQGTVYLMDQRTPAKDVIVYIYHTNRNGIYETNGVQEGWGRRHGYFRGWIKTDANGEYIFYTFRPAAYPGRSEPEHIHMTVKESSKNEYYIDEIVFTDDPLLSQSKRRDLTLNIPNYH